MGKTKVAVLFGGISAEHEVSIRSADYIIKNLDLERFEVIRVKISKKGDFDLDKIAQADIIFPILHGVGGEDGSIQGFCQTIGKPFIGSDIEASALALDKVVCKQIWQNLKLPIPSFQFFDKKQWQEKHLTIMQRIEPPVFVKPANTGSSIGISRVNKKSELQKAIEQALIYGDKIIVEKALENIREIEVAILGNEKLIISIPGEIIPAEEFYSYDAKYKLDSKLIIPAILAKEKIKEIQHLAKKAYNALGCRGMARVDFFLEKPEGKVYLNEINTIPGFTKISMFPKLMEISGIKYKNLLTKLIELGLEK